MDTDSTPHSLYDGRRTAILAEIAAARGRERVFGAARLVTFLTGAALVWMTLVDGWATPWLLALPAALFVWLVLRHNRLIARRERRERAAAFYAGGLERLEGRWRAPHDGRGLLPAEHPYAEDLDLVGPDGLVARISTARTVGARERLAAWLGGPSVAPEIRARQEAVAELRERLDLREDLAVLGEETAPVVDGARLVAWGERARVFVHSRARVIAIASSLFTIVALVQLGRGHWIVLAPLVLAAHVALGYATRRSVSAALRDVDAPAHELSLLAAVTERLDRETFTANRLGELSAALRRDGVGAATEIRALASRVELLDSVHNQLFAPIAFLLHLRLHLAHTIDMWRVRHGGDIRRWMETTGEMEALSVLAGYAFENPDDPFPEITDGEACFRARGIGHPLLPRERCVTNDLTLDRAASLLVVSGSNMSGKSTLLRTVGANAALALAGAPVRAEHLTLTPVALGASLRVADSLANGRSRFLAEIERLKTLVDISRGEAPLLFLVDELLQGTNSHDRRIGAEAVMRTLITNGAIGILTTHDLALTEVAESLEGARNAHFEDHLERGEMAFDYALRPGVVTKSNAVALMRRVGLDV